ncbi:hypothetical protein BG015_000681 [Linnemannia schmuckeri]|uniref:Amino acid transporter n=1 Tax=Linnemannia schmuckeri TaxID=64567 RepID=A0A9P5S6F4_9FUNG|nr:hypothetical protein BG015_000681 [Linnemannia schmuckeri]
MEDLVEVEVKVEEGLLGSGQRIARTSSNVLCEIVTLYGLTLINGGPAWATWPYLVIGIMCFIVSLCLVELASAYPTTGGVRHWVYELRSTRKRPFLTWMKGWLTVVGSVASASSVAFYFSSASDEILFIVRKIALTPGIYIVGVIAAFAIVLLSHAQVEAGWVQVPFTTFLNYSGNSRAVYAALSSALIASFVFCPQDTVIHIVLVESSQCHLGLPIVLGLSYGILRSITGLLGEAIPVVDMILMTLGRPLGITFVVLILIGIFFTGLTRLLIASRVAYSFARNEGLPKFSYWNHL